MPAPNVTYACAWVGIALELSSAAGIIPGRASALTPAPNERYIWRVDADGRYISAGVTSMYPKGPAVLGATKPGASSDFGGAGDGKVWTVELLEGRASEGLLEPETLSLEIDSAGAGREGTVYESRSTRLRTAEGASSEGRGGPAR